MSNNSGNIIVALLAGAVIGAGVGILLAPDKGSKTRQKIKDGVNSSKDDLFEKLKGFTDMIKDKTTDAVSAIDELLEETISSEGNDKEALIALLEQKLKALKASK